MFSSGGTSTTTTWNQIMPRFRVITSLLIVHRPVADFVLVHRCILRLVFVISVH